MGITQNFYWNDEWSFDLNYEIILRKKNHFGKLVERNHERNEFRNDLEQLFEAKYL